MFYFLNFTAAAVNYRHGTVRWLYDTTNAGLAHTIINLCKYSAVLSHIFTYQSQHIGYK